MLLLYKITVSLQQNQQDKMLQVVIDVLIHQASQQAICLNSCYFDIKLTFNYKN